MPEPTLSNSSPEPSQGHVSIGDRGQGDVASGADHDVAGEMISLLGKLSTILIKASNWRDSIDSVLEKIGQSLGVSRVFILEASTDDNGAASADVKSGGLGTFGESAKVGDTSAVDSGSTERQRQPARLLCCAVWPGGDGVDSSGDSNGETGASDAANEQVQIAVAIGLDHGRDVLLTGHKVIKNYDQLSDADRRELEQVDAASVLTIPIIVGREVWGAIGCHNRDAHRCWSGMDVQLLETVAGLIGSAISATIVRQGKQTIRDAKIKRMESGGREHTAMIKALPDLYFRMDRDGRVLDYHEGHSSILFVEPIRLLGKRLRDVLPEPVASQFTQALNQVNETGQLTMIEYQLPINGTDRWFDGRLYPVVDGQVVILIRDITERRADEVAYRESERLATLGTFAAGIAHEINNPLGAIIMAVHGATKAAQQNKNEVLAAMLDQIRADTERSARIVKSVLVFARYQASEKTDTDLMPLIKSAGDQAKSYENAGEVDIAIDCPRDLPAVHVGPTEIEQVFVNLFNNAIQAGADQIRIQVLQICSDGATEADRLEVNLIDNGCGMPEDVLNRAIDPFYTGRVDQGGTGLGLSLCHGMVASHGSTLSMKSKVDKGTMVSFTLPISPPGTSRSDEYAI